MKKITKTDCGLESVYSSVKTAEERTFLDKIAEMMCSVVNKAMDGSLDEAEVQKAFKNINDKLTAYDSEKFQQLIKDNNDLVEQVKGLQQSIAKLEQKGVTVEKASKFAEEINEMFESEKFKQFADNKARTATGFKLKAVSMTGQGVAADANYTGTHLITDQLPNVVTAQRDKLTHVRDFAVVIQGDPEFPILAWQQIYEVNKNARFVTENGTLPESSFKVKEATSGVCRVGHHIRISKRMIKSRAYVTSVIINMMAQGILDAEDYNILFGDGTGTNLKGIVNYDGVKSVESIVSESVSAGSVTSIEATSGGIIINLAKADDLLREGMKIVITGVKDNGGTATNMNATYDVIKVNDTQVFCETSYVPTDYDKNTTAQDAIKYTLKHGAFKSVESPNSIDALETAIAVMTFAQFTPTTLVLNPITLNGIRSEKATDGNRLDVVKDMNGDPIIGGLRVIKSTSVPAGKYLLGDFRNGAQIVDYTGLTLDWADDVDTKLQNQVVLLAQEELIVPVYCPWAFAYGSISALKTAIKSN